MRYDNSDPVPTYINSPTSIYDVECGGDSYWCYHAACPVCGKNNRVAYVQKSKEISTCFEDLCGHLEPEPNRRGDFCYSSKFGDPLRWKVLQDPIAKKKEGKFFLPFTVEKED